ncbi:MAG: glycosyltransferase family 4 protein [Chloroflexi bacterium]|nr:glycosyltransferase family 4 protein [Chloroflexota bacterium]
MKILMALTYYHPHWTGLTAFAVRLAEGLAARGNQVTVLTSQYRRDLPREEVHNGVRVVRVPAVLRLSRGQVMPGFFGAVNRLVREHDVVQVHTPMLETAVVGYLAHRAGRKMLMTHHGDLVMPQGAWNQFVQRTVGYLLNKGAEQADLISIYTQDYADHSPFLRPYADKVVPVYPPFSFPRANSEAALAWRRELGLDGAPLVGFAGRWVEEKGFDYLLEAIPLVRERVPGSKFVFAGETRVVYERFFERCRPLLEAQREHVIELGLITDPQRMADFYAMCNVFALPSRTDCLASVQVEAMLSGTPVVATDIPGAREVVRVTGMGRLVPPRDESALAQGLTEVLLNPDSYRCPYEHITRIFDTDRSIADYEALLERLARS